MNQPETNPNTVYRPSGGVKSSTMDEDEQKPRIASCDQECWVMDRIKTAIRMAVSIKKAAHVKADEHLADYAIEGLIQGAAVEIIHTLRMEPEYVNLRRPARRGER